MLLQSIDCQVGCESQIITGTELYDFRVLLVVQEIVFRVRDTVASDCSIKST